MVPGAWRIDSVEWGPVPEDGAVAWEHGRPGEDVRGVAWWRSECRADAELSRVGEDCEVSFIFKDESARCARGGHFVTGIPLSVGAPVDREGDLRLARAGNDDFSSQF